MSAKVSRWPSTELAATEIVRRAERGIGLAIHKGQEAGDIETRAEAASRAGRISAGVNDMVSNESLKPRPLDFANADEWSGNGAGIRHIADDVTDEQFEAALDAAKAEKNLSRANVVRKVKGDPAPAPKDRPDHLHGTRGP